MSYKVKAIISYDGSKFFGSQAQRENKKNRVISVYSALESVLNSLNIYSSIEFSGRTDRGVHALGQVIAFYIPSFWNNLQKLKNIINQKLNYIYVKKIEFCDSSFSPQFCAISRAYRYIISTNQNPFMTDYITFIKKINEQKLKNAIKLFEGEHNFVLFRKTGSNEKTTIRKIYKTNFYRYKNLYVFYFEANGFLRSQIRMIMGALLLLNNNKLTFAQLKDQVDAKKQYSKILAPPCGLYLTKVKYKLDSL